jgi:hypothetical protein
LFAGCAQLTLKNKIEIHKATSTNILFIDAPDDCSKASDKPTLVILVFDIGDLTGLTLGKAQLALVGHTNGPLPKNGLALKRRCTFRGFGTWLTAICPSRTSICEKKKQSSHPKQ